MTIIGTIQSIEYRITAGHEKKIVTIVTEDKQKVFIEFRNQLMNTIQLFDPGDSVTVGYRFEGHISKNSGIQYNNIIATNLSRVWD